MAKAVATAASTALPPLRRTSRPVSAPGGETATTMPCRSAARAPGGRQEPASPSKARRAQVRTEEEAPCGDATADRCIDISSRPERIKARGGDRTGQESRGDLFRGPYRPGRAPAPLPTCYP